MHPFQIDGVALITGAGSGIGRDTAFAFAEAGASAIVFADLNLGGAEKCAEESKSYATNPKYATFTTEVNIADEDSVKRMVRESLEKFGRIDYNVNSAGIYNKRQPFQALEIAELDRLYEINVRGTALCMRHVVEVMSTQEPRTIETRSGVRSLGRGSIVNLGSVNSHIAGSQAAPYIASKHAVLGLTKAAVDCAPDGVRINAVCPSFVETTMTAPMQELKKVNPIAVEAILPKIGRMALPDEVSGAILFFCSPAATYITGTSLIIDSGTSLLGRV